MKKIILLLVLTVVASSIQSCGGLAAGIVNRQVIEKNTEQYVAERKASLKPLGLSAEQEEKVEAIYLEQITNLKENARREKTKEISNSTSFKNIRYHFYNTEIALQNVLTPEQVLEYQNNKIYNGYSDEQMEKERKKLLKMGYNLNN